MGKVKAKLQSTGCQKRQVSPVRKRVKKELKKIKR
jgi:hypothetical protein